MTELQQRKLISVFSWIQNFVLNHGSFARWGRCSSLSLGSEEAGGTFLSLLTADIIQDKPTPASEINQQWAHAGLSSFEIKSVG